MLVGVLMRRIRLVFGCGLIELGGKFVLLVLDWNSTSLTALCVCLCFCLFGGGVWCLLDLSGRVRSELHWASSSASDQNFLNKSYVFENRYLFPWGRKSPILQVLMQKVEFWK